MKKLWIIIGVIFIVGVVATAYTGWNYVAFVNLKNQCLANLNSVADTMTVNLKIGVGADKLKMLSDYVSHLSGVTSVKIVTAEQVLNEFKVKNSNNQAVLNSLNKLQSNPFGAYMEIYLTDDADVSLIKNSIQLQESNMGIDSIGNSKVRELKKSVSDFKFNFIHQRYLEKALQFVPYCSDLSATIR